MVQDLDSGVTNYRMYYVLKGTMAVEIPYVDIPYVIIIVYCAN